MNAIKEGFSPEQQAYLQGLVIGTDVARSIRNLPVLSGSGIQAPNSVSIQLGTKQAAATLAPGSHLPLMHQEAQARCEQSGKGLVAEEIAKRNKNGLTMWQEIGDRASRGEFPKGTDVFLTKYNGLFHVAPAQNSFMCRMRLPGGILRDYQLEGLGTIADSFAGGYVDVTTRANLQLREIKAQDALNVLMGLRDLGIVTLGSGADNIRNVTCSTLSGIDPTELIETYPLARELHYFILSKPELYGLPRKFNIAFDGSGRISSLAETNDISFHAVEVSPVNASGSMPQGTCFLLGLGGITGHGDFARSTSVLVKRDECIAVCEAILRVFIKHGDRSDRKKSRLKYLLDAWGFDKFLAQVEQEYGKALNRVANEQIVQPDNTDRWAHVDLHPQKQEGLSYVGIVLPVGRITSAQCRGLAAIAKKFGSGELRLTVWQNLIVSNVRNENIPSVTKAIEDLGLEWQSSSFRAGLVACTGSAGCKYAAANTKQHAMILAAYLEDRFNLDCPINIHLTGCHHSCAQHAIGDIGLIATQVEVGDEIAEGYHILLGGKTGIDPKIGVKVFESVAFEEVPCKIATVISTYLAHRTPGQSFAEFSCNYDWRGTQVHIAFDTSLAL